MQINRHVAVEISGRFRRQRPAFHRLAWLLAAGLCWWTWSASALPSLLVNPSEINTETSAGYNAAPVELNIANNGFSPGEAMPYQIAVQTLDGGNWLSVSPTSGVSYGETITHVVSFNSSNLPGNTYKGWFTITAPGAAGSPVQVNVNLRVNHTPVPGWDVGLVEPGLNVQVNEGESVPDREFQVWNKSAVPVGRMRYEINLSDDLRLWIAAVTPASGVSSGELHRVTVQYDVAGLSAGIYGGTLTVRCFDDWNGSPVGELSTNLELRVIGRAALAVEADQLTADVLQQLSQTNVLRIRNAAGAPRRVMRYSIDTDAAWLRFEPETGVVQDGTAAVSVVFSAGALPPGSYSSEFTVDAWDEDGGTRAINAPMTLTASMTVASRAPLNYEPPEVLGIPNIGRMLLARPGLWRNMERLGFEYQWERADAPSGGGQVVARSWSTEADYLVTSADRGKYLRVKVRATDAYPTPLQTTAVSAYRSGKIIATPGDFDGDGRADLWFYNPADGYWYGYLSSGFYGRYFFGAPGMNLTPVPGDYDGNGYLDLCLYDQAGGAWHAMLLPQEQYVSAVFGRPDAVPVPGDYNADGMTDPAIYWAAGGRWYIGNVPAWTVQEVAFGGPGKQGVPGDYDGDGRTDIAVYDAAAGKWTVRGSRDGVWEETLGGLDAMPAAGDYDADGKLDVAVYWPDVNLWQMRFSGNGQLREAEFGVSSGAGMPLPGYYDNDPFCDPGQVEVDGDFIVWCVELSSLTNFNIPYRGQTYQLSTGAWRVSW